MKAKIFKILYTYFYRIYARARCRQELPSAILYKEDQENNDFIVKTVKKKSDRLVGFAGINPSDDDTQNELTRASAGARSNR